MTDFKVNDLVTIVKNPTTNMPNSHIDMVGMGGYIAELQGDYIAFQELKNNGCGGYGSVHISLLKLDNDNVRLQVLKKIKDDNLAKLMKEYSHE